MSQNDPFTDAPRGTEKNQTSMAPRGFDPSVDVSFDEIAAEAIDELGSPAAIQAKIAEAAAAQRQKAKRGGGGPFIGLPGGNVMDARAFAEMRFKLSDENEHLYHADKLISAEFKANHPGYHYGWADKKLPETQRRLRNHSYIALSKDDVDPSMDAPITHDSTDDCIHWYELILIGISPEAYERYYVVPAWKNIRDLARLEGAWEEKVARATGGNAYGTLDKRMVDPRSNG